MSGRAGGNQENINISNIKEYLPCNIDFNIKQIPFKKHLFLPKIRIEVKCWVGVEKAQSEWKITEIKTGFDLYFIAAPS